MDRGSCTHISVAEFSDRPTSDSESDDQANRLASTTLPLLPHLLHARSKASIFEDVRGFRGSLRWCALDHSSCSGRLVSYTAFLVLNIAIPIARTLFVHVDHATAAGVAFHKLAQLPESAVAAIAFLTLACFFRRHGLRRLLFLDGLGEDSLYVRRGYVRELERAFRHLSYILLPSFVVELAHKIMFFTTATVKVPHVRAQLPWNSIMFVAVLASWLYRTGVFLLVCMLFRLTCELQILRLEGFRKVLEGCGSDAGVIFREHMRIKRQLLITSHRYRIFILGCLVTITISQLGALLLVLASKSEKNFFNSGDLVVCSAVQLSGFFMCLMGAARITHRAQGVVAIATRWHILITCASNAASNALKAKNPAGRTEAGPDGFLISNCGSDTDASDDTFMIFPTHDVSSFETRQALGKRV
ncbi:hypothetical protein ACLOJK_030881 [Asimina triloba]